MSLSCRLRGQPRSVSLAWDGRALLVQVEGLAPLRLAGSPATVARSLRAVLAQVETEPASISPVLVATERLRPGARDWAWLTIGMLLTWLASRPALQGLAEIAARDLGLITASQSAPGGRQPDPIDPALLEQLRAAIVDSPGLATATYANRLSVSVPKLERHRALLEEAA